MAPFDMTFDMNNLLERRYVECYSDGVCVRRNRWSDWGRWVVLAIIIIGFTFILFSCSCVARRRRRRGMQPMYGTGWMAPGGGKHDGQNNYHAGYGPQGYGQQPPPAYGQPQQQQYTGTTFNPNEGYYGNANPHDQQQYGVQQPQHAYHPEGNYAPPPGPPPAK